MFPDNAAGPIAELAAGVDELLELDTDTLTDDQLAAVMVNMYREDLRFAAARARMVAALEARRACAADGSSTAAE